MCSAHTFITYTCFCNEFVNDSIYCHLLRLPHLRFCQYRTRESTTVDVVLLKEITYIYTCIPLLYQRQIRSQAFNAPLAKSRFAIFNYTVHIAMHWLYVSPELETHTRLLRKFHLS